MKKLVSFVAVIILTWLAIATGLFQVQDKPDDRDYVTATPIIEATPIKVTPTEVMIVYNPHTSDPNWCNNGKWDCISEATSEESLQWLYEGGWLCANGDLREEEMHEHCQTPADAARFFDRRRGLLDCSDGGKGCPEACDFTFVRSDDGRSLEVTGFCSHGEDWEIIKDDIHNPDYKIGLNDCVIAFQESNNDRTLRYQFSDRCHVSQLVGPENNIP